MMTRFTAEIVRVERDGSSRPRPISAKRSDYMMIEVEARSPEGACVYMLPGDTDPQPRVGDMVEVAVTPAVLDDRDLR